MNIKWTIALVILPSTLYAYYGASIVYGWLTVTFGEFVGYVFFLPALWCILATAVMAERDLSRRGEIGPM